MIYNEPFENYQDRSPFGEESMSLLKKTSLSLAVILSLCVSSDILEAKVPANGLTQAEQISGWKLLFDGKSADPIRMWVSVVLSTLRRLPSFGEE